jgi:hypothetical protein
MAFADVAAAGASVAPVPTARCPVVVRDAKVVPAAAADPPSSIRPFGHFLMGATSGAIVAMFVIFLFDRRRLRRWAEPALPIEMAGPCWPPEKIGHAL